ncbi:MAG: hypothetical protein J6M02_04205 [Clostridia bacterium]|nr:hypothetical protein [Clostridia bacterium]
MEFITNRDQGVLTKMIELLKLQEGEKKLVFGEIEDAVYQRLSPYIGEKEQIFLSADRKCTTKLLFESLLQRNFVYVCNNNLNQYRNQNNLIFVKNGENVKMLLCGFPLTENNIENSSSVAFYFCGKEEEIENFGVMEELFSEGQNGYRKLTPELLAEFDDQKAFRNEKAATISDALDEDEIVKSFRNLQKILDERQKELEVKDLEKKKPIASEIEIEINLD